MLPRRPSVGCFAALTMLAGCGFDVTAGWSMGTTYTVEARCPGGVPSERVAAELDAVDGQMSTFDPGSELAAFNRAPAGVAVPVSRAVVDVVEAAQRVADETGGAFDATVAPLVALWGFGAGAADEPPTDVEVHAVRRSVGYRRLGVRRDPPTLTKLSPLTLDLSAIAKGYAVDRLAGVLEESGCRAYLIEFGGEVRVAGQSPSGGPWRLGVDSPAGGTPAGEGRYFGPPIVLSGGAVATSGDYRQYAERDGMRISHIIDPRTGYPAAHRLASVTVVTDTALYADAYATALMVLGEDAGERFAERHGLAALFVVRAGDGFEARQSRAMDAYRARH